MTIKPIRSGDDLRAAFKQLEQVFQAPAGSPQADEMECWSRSLKLMSKSITLSDRPTLLRLSNSEWSNKT